MDQNSQKNSETEKSARQRMTILKSFNIALEFGFIIALPLLLFVYLGKWLDRHYHTEFIVYLGVALALTASCVWLYRRMISLMKDME